MADEPAADEEEVIPQEFWDVADKFIDLANNLAEEWPVTRVSSAFMYAASRYNVFSALQLDAEAEENKAAIIDYFCAQYREMFTENFEQTLARMKKG